MPAMAPKVLPGGLVGPVPVLAKSPLPAAAVTASVGTFAPHTKVQVGSHRVVIDRFLSEGGFAHVYLVKLPKPVNGSDVAVLKRVAVPDKEALASMRTEVETMKLLQGRRHIVTYMDSHASQLKGGGYEVFLLMEYCAGGGLIDFMNTRLQNRLTEPEILDIFSDVAEGVACMHYLQPPLLHRDLKVENVLIALNGSSRRYKLCDFGSAARPKPAATNPVEFRLLEDEIQKHTTLQYRSPEMVDVYRKQPIDEKSDIWALGVLLYKLCYYTTPFEEKGQLAILNASFRFPGYPPFSDRLKYLIAWMLRENPQARPNIYEVVRETCMLKGKEVPIKNIYAGRTAHQESVVSAIPKSLAATAVASPPTAGAFYAQQSIASEPRPVLQVTPMRRGRPQAAPPQQPNPSNVFPLRGVVGDPFAALDSGPDITAAAASQDELSARFPAIEQFSLLHDAGTKFEFDQRQSSSGIRSTGLKQKVTERLADEAFAKPLAPAVPTETTSIQPTVVQPDALPRREASDAAPPNTRLPATGIDVSRPVMISQGTMTSPSPPSGDGMPLNRQKNSRHEFAFSAPTSSGTNGLLSTEPRRDPDPSSSATLRPKHVEGSRPGPPGMYRSKSHTSSPLKTTSPSRASMDLRRAPSLGKTFTAGRRPASVYVESKLSVSRNDHSSQAPISDSTLVQSSRGKSQPPPSGSWLDRAREDTKITSNVDFLRAMEDEDTLRKKDRRWSGEHRHIKRASMPSISLSSTKTLLAGKFGDAFRRFETHSAGSLAQAPDSGEDRAFGGLSPITMSEATGDRSDDGHVVEEDTVAPELRRELERRALEQEERRVEAAAQEYRRRVASRPVALQLNATDSTAIVGQSKAASIQETVKSLLDENNKPDHADWPAREDTGDGRQNAPSTTIPVPSHQPAPADAPSTEQRVHSRASAQQERQLPFRATQVSGQSRQQAGLGVPTGLPAARRTTSRPSAPPKPEKLRGSGQAVRQGAVGLDHHGIDSGAEPHSAGAYTTAEMWEANFSRRYPSLSQLEMVETDIERIAAPSLRSKGA